MNLTDLDALNDCRKQLADNYLRHYRNRGYQMTFPLPITSTQDESVIFIGSAISGLKKDYIAPLDIPETGIVTAQPSVRTRNIKNMLASDFNPKWGSYFTNIDTIAPYERKEKAFDEVLDFFLTTAQIPERDLVLRVNSNDRELFDLAASRRTGELEIDANPERFYRHSIGLQGIYGENFNFAVRHKYSRQYSDVGNFIIFRDEETKKPLFLEVGFGDTVIMQAREGLNHVMDCYPFPSHPGLDKNYKFKDCIITSTALMREGLYPSSRNQQSKILYKYLRGLHYFASQAGMRPQELSRVLYISEKMIFGDVNAEPQITELFKNKQTRIEELNLQTLAELKKKGLTK